MRSVILPVMGTNAAWRNAARDLAARGVPPEEVLWQFGEGGSDLFAAGQAAPPGPNAPGAPALRVPRAFVALAGEVTCHSDPERFALLYAMLWRLQKRPGLLSDRGDAQVDRLEAMAKSVRRDMHKMKAFVRFRDIGGADGKDPGARRAFAAWFEPEHNIVEATAPFFAKRFGDMDWTILTPKGCARFDREGLHFSPGAARPPLPEDATEELWTIYFRNIFNPARLKVKAMQSEMPRKYWKNMPETAAIPEMIAGAEARVRGMQAAAPSLPPLRAERILERNRTAPGAQVDAADRDGPLQTRPDTWPALDKALAGCRRCPLHADATQVVPGRGPRDAALMIVGEQPGDHEDLTGQPFVGPAGQLLDRAAREAGLNRDAAFITNAVKHFKFAPRGKRRIHQRPVNTEVMACKWWLDVERELLRPRLILALGATAARALTGNGDAILARRGRVERTADGTPVLLTVHPSYLLRRSDAATIEADMAAFVDDLRHAARLLAA